MTKIAKFQTAAFLAYLITAMVVLVPLSSYAEAADASQVKAPKGGEIKPIRDGYIEVVQGRGSIKIFLYDKNLKPEKQLKDFSIVAEVQRPYTKDLENLELRPTRGGFTASFDPSSDRKYNLDLGIANRRNGTADRTSFDLEAPASATASE